MKSPARASGTRKSSTAKKPAAKKPVVAAKRTTRPAASAKQAAPVRRSSAKPIKPIVKAKPKAVASRITTKAAVRPKAKTAAKPQPVAKPNALSKAKTQPKSAAKAASQATRKPPAKDAAKPAPKAASKPANKPAVAAPAKVQAAKVQAIAKPAAKPIVAAKPPAAPQRAAPINMAKTAAVGGPHPREAAPIVAQTPAPPKPDPASPAAAPTSQAKLPVMVRSGGQAPNAVPMPPRREGPPALTPRQPAKQVDFKTGDHVVYPTHGVGTVQGIETMSAAGYALQVIVVTFDENRMTLRVPINKAASSGLRKLATDGAMQDALDTLKGKARIKRTMWSRRAQEYEAKINSGDPVAIAEVVRDLHRNAGQPDQSFSERQIYEQAMDRLAAEVAAIDQTDKLAATDKMLRYLKGGDAKQTEPAPAD
jgi:CarD family transcriptional regulator